MRWLLLCFAFAQSQDSSFNFEISHHVTDVVSKILQSGTWQQIFSKNYFETGYADSHDYNATGSLFYFLSTTNLQVRNVYCGWENGAFVSVIHGSPGIPVLQKTFNLSGTFMWSQRLPGANQNRSYYETDAIGRPTTFLRSVPYDHRMRPWYQAAKAAATDIWYGPLVFASILESGITYCKPLYLPNGTFDGILALDFALIDISAFLALEYANSSRKVYIVDTDGYLIGSSTSVDLLVKNDTEMVVANASSDPMLTKIYSQLVDNQFNDALVILNSGYVQTVTFRDSTNMLDWRILVSMPASPAKDFLLITQDAAIPIIVISTLACTVSVVALGFVGWHRNAKIIRMSQRRLMSVFLSGCLLLNLSFLAYLGPNTLAACRFRTWWPNLMFTLAFAPILVKTWYMYSVFTSKVIELRTKGPERFTGDWWKARFVGLTARTVGLFFLEVIILMCAHLTGEMDPYSMTVLGSDGAYQTRTFCGPDGVGPFNVLDLIYKVSMVAVGCLLAFRTRHISSFLAESYSLAIIVYSISIFGLVVLLITKTATMDVDASLLLRTIGVCWSTTVSTVVLLAPRFYKLLTIGDEAAMAWLRKGPLSANSPMPSTGVSMEHTPTTTQTSA